MKNLRILVFQLHVVQIHNVALKIIWQFVLVCQHMLVERRIADLNVPLTQIVPQA